MSLVRSLRIKLGHQPVGSLFGVDDGRVYFRFDDAYARHLDRPVLSQLYVVPGGDEPSRAATMAQLLDPALAANRGSGNGRLPPFFQNLLPEGQLRKQLIADLGLTEEDELGLLGACGADLPGDVWAEREELDERALGRLLGQGWDSYEMSSVQIPTPEQTSLSGVQPKVALVKESGGRYVMRSRTGGGTHFIGKLPAADYQNMPEVEYTSMRLAKAAGVNVCQVELMPLSAIADQLPFSLRDDARHFLLVQRYDRDVDTATGRRHAEDFAQVTGRAADDKYEGTYAALGALLLNYSAQGEADVEELLRRIMVSELLGNYDAHLKNFSLLYDLDGRTPRLSPAYDLVAYAVYFSGKGHGLKFLPDQTGPMLLTPRILRQLSGVWGLLEKRMRNVVRDTVDAAMRQWLAIIRTSPLSASHQLRLLQYVVTNPSALAWMRRNPHSEWPQGLLPMMAA
jgi:serine/threonine-protein kinase HipA